MGEAPENSDLPTTASNQHGDAAKLDIFAELERSGVPAQKSKEAQSKETDSKAPSASRSKSASKAESKPAAKSEPNPAAKSGSEAAEPKSAAAPSTALLFQPPDHGSARRPRRASAPAGPTASADSEEQSQSETEKSQSSRRGGQRGGSGAQKSTSGTQKSASDAKDASGSAKESRGASDKKADKTSDKASEKSTRPSGDSDAQEADFSSREEAENDFRSEGDDGGRRRRRRRGGRGRRGRGGGNNHADSDSRDDRTGDQQSENGGSASDSEAKSGGDGKNAGKDGGRGAAKSGRDESTGSGSGEKRGEKSSDESGAADKSGQSEKDNGSGSSDNGGSGSRRRRRRRRGGSSGSRSEGSRADEVATPRGSTRLEAKRQRRREGRDSGRRKPVITEAEFLARRESVKRDMLVREHDGRMQIAVLEDGVLVEHYVSHNEDASIAGNVYVGKVQNVLPSMEAAFVDIGKGRNAVLYAGEVNWDAAGLDEHEPRRIEMALNSGDHVLVQVTKDPIGHKGARLTGQISLAGRFLVFVPNGSMTGISRKLPDTERTRLKKILKDIVPEGGGVIVRTAAEGASEEELRADIERLQKRWRDIESAQKGMKKSAGLKLVHSEADMAIRIVRDIFNEDIEKLVVSGDQAWEEISTYVEQVASDLTSKLSQWASKEDIFAAHRIDEQLAKAMDRKVYLPSGGSLVIDRTEAMTVVDVNTGRFTGTGGTLEETVTKNNLEAAEEVVRQLRLRDIGGIIVIDFIDMVLEQNRDLVMRRLVECLGRDRTKHQVAEVTSLGLVQMTRKRVGQGLVEAFSEKCEHCNGRGFITHDHPVEKSDRSDKGGKQESKSDKNNSDDDSNKNRGDNNGRRNRRKKSGSHDNSRDNFRNGKGSHSGGVKSSESSQDDASKSGGDSSEGNGPGKSRGLESDGETQQDDVKSSEVHAAGAEGNAAPSETPEEVRAALAAIAAAAVQSHEKNEGSADAQQKKSDAKIEDHTDGKESSPSTSEG